MIFPRRFGFTGKKHLPMLGVTGPTYYPHRFLSNFWKMRNWRIVEYKESFVTVERDKASVQRGGLRSIELKLDERWFDTFFCEWPDWKQWYLPDSGLSGKTILDVGAGCGESAAFFFEHGAFRVIGIEPTAKGIQCLRDNATTNRWNLEIIPRGFRLSDLKMDFDFLKVDIEGGEIELLTLDRLPSCSIEVHSVELLQKFKEKFPYLQAFNVRGRTQNWVLKGQAC